MLNRGVTMVQVAALLGRESLNATARYIQPTEQELEEAVKKIKL